MDIFDVLILFAVMVTLAALPSSSTLLVVASSASRGVQSGIAAAIGVVFGDLVFVLLAILGLAVISESIGSFFAVLKMIGGAYLIWLGISLWRLKSSSFLPYQLQKNGGLLVSFFAGFFLTLSDMKAIIFYAALLPFFIDLRSATPIDFALILGITIFSVGLVKILYALFAFKIVKSIKSKQLGSAPQKLVGTLMVGIGGYTLCKP